MAKETEHGTLAIPNPVQNSLTGGFADGGIDCTFNPNDLKGRQDMPTNGVLPDKPAYQPTSVSTFGPVKFDPDPSMDGQEAEADERDVVPDQEIVGGIPSPFEGIAGNQVPFDRVAPYKYPEFPADSYKSGGTGALFRGKQNPTD